MPFLATYSSVSIRGWSGTGAENGPGSGYLEIQKLLASDRAGDDYFGDSVSISADGNTALIGASREDTSPYTDNGAAYIFTRSGGTWTQQAKLLAGDLATGDQFGRSVSLSADGNTALIGAPLHGALYNRTGAAYVFTRSGNTWTQQAKLLASDRASTDLFGGSVSLSADGNTALVAARYEGDSTYDLAGAAYVFRRSGSTWTEQAKLTASDRQNHDYFGTSVSLSGDGNTAIIGTPSETTLPSIQNGAAYVFTRSGTTWTQQAKLLASDRASRDYFGQSVSLSADGNTALVGALREDTAPPYTDNGAAYVFTRSGSTWTQVQKLLAGDRESDDRFGVSVSLSADGNTALVSALREDTAPYTDNGAVYVFTRSGSTWTQVQKLLAGDRESDDYFGSSVSISADGNTLIIGAHLLTIPYTGHGGYAYIFIRQ